MGEMTDEPNQMRPGPRRKKKGGSLLSAMPPPEAQHQVRSVYDIERGTPYHSGELVARRSMETSERTRSKSGKKDPPIYQLDSD